MLTYTVKTIRMAPYVIACSMQHISTVLTYPGSCKTCFFHIPVFGEVFLIFPIIYLTVDLKLICIIGLSDQINPLIFAVIWLLNLTEQRHVAFWPVSTVSTLQITLKLSICHAQTSLFVKCAGGSQGVQLLDGSNKG